MMETCVVRRGEKMLWDFRKGEVKSEFFFLNFLFDFLFDPDLWKGEERKKRIIKSYVGEPRVVQRVPDCPDTPVHHVRGRHAVGSGPCLGDGLAAEELDGLVVEDLAVVGDDAVVAVAVVRVQRDVRVHFEVGEFRFEEADGALDEAVGVEGLLSRRGLEVLGSLFRFEFEFFFSIWERVGKSKTCPEEEKGRSLSLFSLLPFSLPGK